MISKKSSVSEGTSGSYGETCVESQFTVYMILQSINTDQVWRPAVLGEVEDSRLLSVELVLHACADETTHYIYSL